MIEETALVLSCEGEVADIETRPQGGCGSCASSGTCGVGVFAKVFGNRKTVVSVVNCLHAKPGDQVIIGLQESALSKASLVFYLVPIVSMILFAILAQAIAIRFGSTASDPAAIIGGVIGMIAGLGVVRIFARKVQSDSRYQPIMLRFASSERVKFDINPKLSA